MSSSKQESFGGVDVWKEFESYVYSFEAVRICSDMERFQDLMSVFSRYESEVSYCSYMLTMSFLSINLLMSYI